LAKRMLTCTREELDCWVDVIRANKGSHAEVDYSTHTLSVLWNNLQKTILGIL